MTGCDTSGSKVASDFSKSEQAWHELIFAAGEGEGGAVGLQPLPVKTLEVSYPDLDLTPSSGMLAILITG